MAYVTLQQKLKRNFSKGKNKIAISLVDFQKIFDDIIMSYDSSFDFIPAENKNKEYIFSTFRKAFVFLEKTANSENIGISCHFYLNGKKEAIKFPISPLDLWNDDVYQEYYLKYFEEAKSGDLIRITHPEAYLIQDLEEVLFCGIRDASWDLVLEEGQLVTLLEKVKIENLCLVKVLYKTQAYWMFGGFYPHTHETDKEKSHHLI